MTKKRIALLAVAAAIFLCGLIANSIFTNQELSSYELEFLNCFGDVNSDMEGGAHLSMNLVVRTDLYNIKNIISRLNKSEEVRFDNAGIKIQEFNFAESDLKYGTLKEIMLNITYNVKGEAGVPMEVNKIFVGEKSYDIGSICFIPTKFDNNQALDAIQYSGMHIGSGLADYNVVLRNNAGEIIQIDSIDAKRLQSRIKRVTIRRGDHIAAMDPPDYWFTIEENIGDAEVRIQFDSTNLANYTVFYFSLSLLYHTEDGVSHRRNLYSYTSGLLFTNEDIRSTGIKK